MRMPEYSITSMNTLILRFVSSLLKGWSSRYFVSSASKISLDLGIVERRRRFALDYRPLYVFRRIRFRPPCGDTKIEERADGFEPFLHRQGTDFPRFPEMTAFHLRDAPHRPGSELIFQALGHLQVLEHRTPADALSGVSDEPIARFGNRHGNPEGGHDLGTFMTIIRTGHDYDKLHLNCGNGVTDDCYNAPVNSALLQVMPWPKFQNMTDYQLTAIWTYLSTVPCNAHNDTLGTTFPWLKNVCSN